MAPHALLNQQAPADIIVKNQHNEEVNTSDFIGKSTVVLFFYPKNNCFICNKEVCAFRDNLEEIQKLGAEVIGVSPDTVKSHEQYANKQKLPYTLLADTEGQLRAAYQVPKVLFGFQQRMTFIIDIDGEITHVFESLLNHNYHINSVMKVLQQELEEDVDEVSGDEE
ncbi:peroxiredoxin [Pilaira anomala]|nr:peroxiredoxin [Pilaira anomala]